MMAKMGNFYGDLKKEKGINENFMKIDKNDIICRIEDVIKSIKPNCDAKNFKELL